MEQTIVCITCPRGCTMTVNRNGDEITVTGNSCKRGEAFAKAELTDPKRTICSTVKTAFKEAPVVPCRVSCDIPKDRIFECMEEINKVLLTERMGRGDVIISNVLGAGADVILTSNILKY